MPFSTARFNLYVTSALHDARCSQTHINNFNNTNIILYILYAPIPNTKRILHIAVALAIKMFGGCSEVVLKRLWWSWRWWVRQRWMAMVLAGGSCGGDGELAAAAAGGGCVGLRG